MKKKPPIIKIKKLPEKVFEYGKENVITKSHYHAGFEDGAEAQRDADVVWCEQAKAEVARDIGEGLCILIGNLMLKDKEAGIILGNQLNEFIQLQIKHKYLKGGK